MDNMFWDKTIFNQEIGS